MFDLSKGPAWTLQKVDGQWQEVRLEGAECRRGGPRPASGPAPADAVQGSAARLETQDYKVKRGGGAARGDGKTESRRVVERVPELRPCRCKARTCPECGRGRAYELRRVLQEKVAAGGFRCPQLLTFTCDPGRFAGPAEAFDYVTGGAFIPRLMRLLGIRVWVAVLEFHKGRAENGYAHRGWPHWHVLVDLDVRGVLTRDDLRRVWRLWRDEWQIGAWDACKRVNEKGVRGDSLHAVNYLTKYLTKADKLDKCAAWFLEGKRRRMVFASRAVGALVYRRPRRAGLRVGESVRQVARSLVLRMAECGESCKLLVHEIESGGDVRTRYVRGVGVSWHGLVEVALGGEYVEQLRALGTRVVLCEDGKPGSLLRVNVVVPAGSVDDLEAFLGKIDAGRARVRVAERLARWAA